MDPFIKYLQHAKQLSDIASTNTPVGIHVVMGNESCDLDSMISTLALGYLRYQDTSFVIPIMNINSQDFPLRTENDYLLKKIGIDPNLLVFRNTFDLEGMQHDVQLKLSLVDHHVLNDKDRPLAPSIVEIFDHRPVDPQANFGSNINVTIKQVGSCATLILDEIFKFCDAKNSILCETLAVLLHSAITFDTIGFSAEAGKATPLDTTIAEKLVTQFNLSNDFKALFDELWNAHNDVSHLTPKQLLSKDLKIVEGIPIPGLPMLVEHFFKLPNVHTDMIDFCASKNSDVMVLMGLHVQSKVFRDLAIFNCGNGQPLAEALARALEGTEELSLVRVVINMPQVVYFTQHNIKLSRKFVLPIIKEVVTCN